MVVIYYKDMHLLLAPEKLIKCIIIIILKKKRFVYWTLGQHSFILIAGPAKPEDFIAGLDTLKNDDAKDDL